jgi:hypothetical protein
LPGHPGGYASAHTSPVYVKRGDERIFDGPSAEHMLALVEGGIEYLENLATVFDDASRKRMVKLYRETQRELSRRLAEEGATLHHGHGPYHTHGPGDTDHHHR